jgi:pantoate--beta-alanine ligase
MRHLDVMREPISELAFVPTMGALHDGHLALIKKAKNFGRQVLVSVYVNPTQFESSADLAKYPKTIERDLELASSAGADYLWTPAVEEIYPEGLANVEFVPAGALGDLYEGVSRPNHFSGVLTVINRLFKITSPRYAIFGEKDFQQLFLIRRFARESFPNTEIISGETVRDENGIALSSRNSRLSSDELVIARVLPRAQEVVKESHELAFIRTALREVLARQSGFTLDYAEIVDPLTLQPVSSSFTGQVQVLIAGWVGSVRLIDNFSHHVKGRS